MADQNLAMSDGISTLVGHFVPPIFCCNIWLNHLQNYNLTFLYATLSNVIVCSSDQIFLLSDQNGALVGHMSFQGKKFFAALQLSNSIVCEDPYQGLKQSGLNAPYAKRWHHTLHSE